MYNHSSSGIPHSKCLTKQQLATTMIRHRVIKISSSHKQKRACFPMRTVTHWQHDGQVVLFASLCMSLFGDVTYSLYSIYTYKCTYTKYMYIFFKSYLHIYLHIYTSFWSVVSQARIEIIISYICIYTELIKYKPPQLSFPSMAVIASMLSCHQIRDCFARASKGFARSSCRCCRQSPN